ncbi:hypothetical protein B9Z51_02310 [Limnohabitans sp. T6-5]|uniref:hypothetical protein n=1 Tax=Limnohabitans sp. T6-5 TaxID=1100724 RepID=UPI000D3D5678|nr:hypothetical protein [Limnohabitans sp. T6-5]PUE11170.1 hypothetical protein B9Z51_02310 [Limnohabitans sp. T6-5]
MRFAQLGDEKLIECELLFAFRKDAWDVEQTLLDHFDKYRTFGKFSNDPQMPLAGRGQSELFRDDILGLDSDLYHPSDEEAIDLKKEFAETGEGCLLTLIGLALVPFTFGLSLLFIAGGLSGVFGNGVKVPPLNKRPQHPPHIKSLIDSLVQAHSADIGLAQPNP